MPKPKAKAKPKSELTARYQTILYRVKYADGMVSLPQKKRKEAVAIAMEMKRQTKWSNRPLGIEKVTETKTYRLTRFRKRKNRYVIA